MTTAPPTLEQTAAEAASETTGQTVYELNVNTVPRQTTPAYAGTNRPISEKLLLFQSQGVAAGYQRTLRREAQERFVSTIESYAGPIQEGLEDLPPTIQKWLMVQTEPLPEIKIQ